MQGEKVGHSRTLEFQNERVLEVFFIVPEKDPRELQILTPDNLFLLVD